MGSVCPILEIIWTYVINEGATQGYAKGSLQEGEGPHGHHIHKECKEAPVNAESSP